MIKKLFLPRILFLLLFGCYDTKEPSFSEELRNRILDQKYILIIPFAGCAGCISQAENFVKENVNKSNNILYVFTRINSQKELRIRLGSPVFYHKNVFLDTLNKIDYRNKMSIYPSLIYLGKDKRIIKIEYQSPENTELLSKLVKMLN